MGSSDIRQRDVVQKYVEGRLLQYARFTVTCERCGRTYQVDLPEQQRYDLRCDCGHVGTIYIQNLNTLVIRTIKNASEADLFASRLLMPRERFLKAAGRHKAGLASILALTEHFGTSVSTAIRYVDCDILPCAVLKWGADGLTWKSLSAEAFRASFRKTIEAVDKLPDDCATRRALRGDPVPQAGFFEQGTTVSAWFPFVKSGDGRNAILIEQAVALGRFGVLTFIFPADGKFS